MKMIVLACIFLMVPGEQKLYSSVFMLGQLRIGWFRKGLGRKNLLHLLMLVFLSRLSDQKPK